MKIKVLETIRGYFIRKLLVYLRIADLYTAVGNLIAVIRYAYALDGEDTVAENRTAYKITRVQRLIYFPTFSNNVFESCIVSMDSRYCRTFVAFCRYRNEANGSVLYPRAVPGDMLDSTMQVSI